MGPFPDPSAFDFVPALERAFGDVLAELRALGPGDFVEAPDSLTTARAPYDERGWLQFGLFGEPGEFAANRERCPRAARACAAVPGLVNACFSLFRPGTHLAPHRGERPGVLRCHLGLVVPDGDVALRAGTELRRWVAGRCLILDDTFEHEAWNRGAEDRVVWIVSFRAGTVTHGV